MTLENMGMFSVALGVGDHCPNRHNGTLIEGSKEHGWPNLTNILLRLINASNLKILERTWLLLAD